MDAIPVVDLRLLSQSEISALAQTSSSSSSSASSSNTNSTSNAFFSDESLALKIDRSTFNESAGSRKQTYSRLRLAPPSSSPRRRGRPPRSSPLVTSPSSNDDNHLSILRFLRRLFLLNGLDHALLPLKRRRRTKDTSTVAATTTATTTAITAANSPPSDEDREILNAKGVAVDLADLGENGDRVFAEEIARRTAGIGSDEGLLGFLAGLQGRWATARKRRRIVDASGFADALPKGWKLLLALKRKEGRIWVHCRRFLSPGGKQFITCMEVSSYMLSLVGPEAALNFPSGSHVENTPMSLELTDACGADITEQDDCKMDVPMPSSNCPDRAVNTSKTKVSNSPECRKCNMKFLDKKAYDQHWLTFHLGAKRSSLGKSISSGVIVKDGKYECQFCHKTFSERRRYNGHVGVHVRFQSEASETMPYIVPCVMPAEPRPQSPSIEALSLPSSEKQDEKGQSEPDESLPCVNHSESMPEPSSLNNLTLSPSETKDGVAIGNTADMTTSTLTINELKVNAEDSCHSKSNVSDFALDPSTNNHADVLPNNCNCTAEEFRSDVSNCKSMGIDISVNVKGDFEAKNDLLGTVHEMPDHYSMGDATVNDNGECLDINIENRRPVVGEKENCGPIENRNIETDTISTSDIQITYAGADIDQSDGKSEKVESSKITDCDKLAHLWVDRCNSSEEQFHSDASNMVTDADGENRLPDHGHSLEEEAGEIVSKNSTSKSTDHMDGNIIPDGSKFVETSESVRRESTSKLVDNLGTNIISAHGFLEEEAHKSAPKSSATKSVDDLAGNMMGETLRNSSEMGNMHTSEDAYNKKFPMPCTGTTTETPVDRPGIAKVSCFKGTDSSLKSDMESGVGGFEACSMDCDAINAPETEVVGGNEVNIQDILKENIDMITQSSNQMSTRAHASVNSESASLGIMNPSDGAYAKKDPPVSAAVHENKNYDSNFKFNPHSSTDNLSSIWQHSTEGELFANRSASGLENSICDQQFFLEDNLQSIPGDGSSYGIQTSTNDILASVVEEHAVGTINNYSGPESGLLVGQGLSNENAVANSFMHSSNRPEPGAKEPLLIPPSTSQSFCIRSNVSTENDMLPFHIQDSFMCQTRNSGGVFEGSLGCSFDGSDKVPVVDNSGTDLLGSAAARTQPQWIQPPGYFSSASVSEQDKANKCYYTDQQRESLAEFEGMRLDGYGPPTSGLLTDQDSQIQPPQQMTFDYSDRNMENVFAPPIQLDWNIDVPQMDTRDQVTTTCMWCGANFTQHGSNIQVQPDSIGFICPTCKAKISGQLKF